MKTKKLNKQTLKDLKAYARVKQIVTDPVRHQRVEQFIQEDSEAINSSVSINIFIKNSKIKVGGKK